MNSITSPRLDARAARRFGPVVDKLLRRGGRRTDPAASPPADADEAPAAVWPDARTQVEPPNREWLFSGLLMCTGIAALPLLVVCLVAPGRVPHGEALANALLVGLPVLVPMPFLLVGCVLALAFDRAARSATCIALFGASLSIGALAALAAWR